MERASPKLFFWLSINYVSNFPLILSLSYAANPRAIVVKCDVRQHVRCRFDNIAKTTKKIPILGVFEIKFPIEGVWVIVPNW